MSTKENRDFRKIARDFKGRIERMKHTPIENLEAMFLELYNFGIEEYIRTEKKKDPKKKRKAIILDMYKLHDKLKKMSRKLYAK